MVLKLPLLPVQTLEAVKGPVYGLTYERGDTEIFMAGYKLAAAKLTSSSALGCLASFVGEPEDLGKVNVCELLVLVRPVVTLMALWEICLA